MSQHTTRSQEDLTGMDLTAISKTLSGTAKHVRRSRSTTSDTKSSSKHERFEDKSLLN